MLEMFWSNPTIPSLLTLALMIVYTLCILAYPPRNRYLAFALWLLPATHAFIYQLSITPWYQINDTLGRLLYIEAAHVSNVLLIEGWNPQFAESDGWKERFRLAGKLLYTRKLGPYRTVDVGQKSKKCDEIPGPSAPQQTRLSFGLQHLLQFVLCLGISHILEGFFWPADLNYDRVLRLRLAMVYDVCISDALWFTSIHSVFAILYVVVLRLDMPHEWTPLFGPLSSAYTVRRYWGIYWHDFIRESFSAHTKLITRRSCGWVNTSALRRVVENSAVFVVSGAMHAVVVFVQTQGRGDMSCVLMWFSGQMLPIIVEGVVCDLWVRSGLRARVEGRVGNAGELRVERGFGYIWVFGWMMWSVPMYLNTKQRWELEDATRRYPMIFEMDSGENLTVDGQ
jgi:hypothetical protein